MSHTRTKEQIEQVISPETVRRKVGLSNEKKPKPKERKKKVISEVDELKSEVRRLQKEVDSWKELVEQHDKEFHDLLVVNRCYKSIIVESITHQQ